MEGDGEHSPKNKEEVFSNRPNMDNKGQRDRGNDPMWSGGKTANWFLIPGSTQTRS